MATIKEIQQNIEWAFKNDNQGLRRFLIYVFGEQNMNETMMQQSHEMLLRFIAQIPYCLNVLKRTAKGTGHEAFAKLVEQRCIEFYERDDEPLPDNYFNHYGVGMLIDDAYFVSRAMERVGHELNFSQSFKKNFFPPNGFLEMVLGKKIVNKLKKEVEQMIKDAHKANHQISPNKSRQNREKIIGTWIIDDYESIGPENFSMTIHYRRTFKANGQFTTWIQLQHYKNVNEPDVYQYGSWELKGNKLLLHHQYKKRTETYPFIFANYDEKKIDYDYLKLRKPVVSKRSVTINNATVGIWKRS